MHRPFVFAMRTSFGLVAASAVIALASVAHAESRADADQVEATINAWTQAFNSEQPTGRFFTPDASLIRGNGVFDGGGTIEEMEQRESRAGLRLALKLDRVQALGKDNVWALGQYTLTVPGKDGAAPQHIPGVSVHVLQREGASWRIRISSFTRLQTPPARASASLK